MAISAVGRMEVDVGETKMQASRRRDRERKVLVAIEVSIADLRRLRRLWRQRGCEDALPVIPDDAQLFGPHRDRKIIDAFEWACADPLGREMHDHLIKAEVDDIMGAVRDTVMERITEVV